jgi:hypothetical protein
MGQELGDELISHASSQRLVVSKLSVALQIVHCFEADSGNDAMLCVAS